MGIFILEIKETKKTYEVPLTLYSFFLIIIIGVIIIAMLLGIVIIGIFWGIAVGVVYALEIMFGGERVWIPIVWLHDIALWLVIHTASIVSWLFQTLEYFFTNQQLFGLIIDILNYIVK